MNSLFFNKNTICYSLGVLGLLFLIPVSSLSAPIQVNTTTANNQRDADIAIRGDGDVIIVWTNEQDGQEPATGAGTPKADIMGRRYNSGAPYTALDGTEVAIQINGDSSFDDTAASVSMNSTGLAYIVYSIGNPGPGTDILRDALNFDLGLGGTITTIDNAGNGQILPHSAVNDSGTDAATWSHWNGANYDIKSENPPSGASIVTNAGTGASEFRSAIAIDKGGNTMTIWDEGDGKIYGELRNPSQAVVKARFQLNSNNAITATNAEIAMNDDGYYSVVWQGSDGNVYMRSFTPSGDPFGVDTRVNTTTTNNQVTPDIAKDSDGNFVVTWVSIDGANNNIYSATYDRLGTSITGETLRATTTDDPRSNNLQNLPDAKVDVNDSGTFAIAYTDYNATTKNDVYFDVFSEAGFSVDVTTAEAIWQGGNGTWSTAANWDTNPTIPHNGVDTWHVKIDDANPAASTVTLDSARTITDLTINGDDALSINNNVVLLFSGSSSIINNSGLITLNSTGNTTGLRFDSPNTLLVGGGTVTLGSGSTANYFYGFNNNEHLINADNLIQGRGQVGNNSISLANSGTVNANTGTIIYDLLTNGNLNTGILQASSGGVLQINAADIDNNGGVIQALTGSRVDLNGVTISGGTVTTAGTGVVRNISGTTELDGSTNAVTVNGNFEQQNASTTFIDGTIINNATWDVNNGGSNTAIRLRGDTALNGTGSIVLGNGSNSVSSLIYGIGTTQRLTVGASQTIEGHGQIGLNNLFYMTNTGLIDANHSGLVLTLDPTDAADGVINTAIMQSSNGGVLRFNTGTYNNAGGLIQALTGSSVEFAGSAWIEGGTLSSAGTGFIRNNSNSTLDGTTSAVTLTGNFEQSNASTTHINGTIINNAQWDVNNSGSTTAIRLRGDTALNGTGTITMGNGATNNTSLIYGLTTVRRLTVGANQTIEGHGQLGGNNVFSMTNNGLIDANAATGHILTVDPTDGADGVINTTIMQASGNGILKLNTGSYNNVGGLIQALNGSRVYLSGAVIQGGTLSSTGTGFIRNTINSSTLDGNTNSVTINGNFEQTNSTKTRVSGTIINNATWDMKSGNSNTDIQLFGDTVFDGTGTVVMGSGTTNNFSLVWGTGSARQLTIGANQTFSGNGQLGVNTNLNIVNNGLIDANSNGSSLVVDATSFVTNTTTMQASNGGILQLNAGTYGNNGGLIQALDTSRVYLSGAVIQGGVLSSSGSGFIRNIVNSSTVDGSTGEGAVTINGNFEQTNATLTRVKGTIVNNATWDVKSGNNNTEIQLIGDTTFNGTGEIVMGSGTTNNFSLIRGTGSARRLTIGASQSLVGNGQVGVNTNLNVTNNGLIDANSNGSSLVLDPTTDVTNTTTMQASNGGTLQLSAGTYANTGGLIQALNGSRINLAGALVQGGTLSSTGTGLIRNATSGSTIDGIANSVTINGNIDQTNGILTNIRGIIVNNASWDIKSSGNNTEVKLTGDVTLNGTGSLIFGSGATTTHSIMRGNSGLRTLTVGASQTIEGVGQMGLGTSFNLTNNGTIEANRSTYTLTVNTTNSLINNGVLKASNGGRLLVQDAVSGTGAIVIDAGAEIEFGAFNVHNTDGTAGNATINGTLDLNGTTLYAEDVTIGSTAQLQIASGIVADGDFTFALTDETVWGLDGPTAVLTMTGGVGATAVTSYANLEIGGEDWGTDPAPGTVVGAAAGFVDNFDLTKLVIGTGAKINLVDLVDNGNRIEHGFGTDEALYVDVLEFSDTTSILNLNGKHLYYNSIIGDVAQIADSPVVYTDWTDGVNDDGTPFNSGAVGALPAFELEWTGVGDIATSGDASILAVGSPAALPGSEWAYVTTAGGDVVAYEITPTTAVTSGSMMFSVDTAGLVLPNGQDLAGLYLYKDGVELFSVSSVNGSVVTFLTPSTFSEFSLVANPEPATVLMLLLSFAGLGFRKIKR